jgi:hypothetical protein
MEPGIVFLEGRVDIGAVGAVGATSRTPGVTVTRTGVGAYTFALDDGSVPRGIVGLINLLIAAGSPPLYGRMTSRSGSQVTFLVEDAAGVDSELVSGSEIHYMLVAGNSSVVTP